MLSTIHVGCSELQYRPAWICGWHGLDWLKCMLWATLPPGLACTKSHNCTHLREMWPDALFKLMSDFRAYWRWIQYIWYVCMYGDHGYWENIWPSAIVKNSGSKAGLRGVDGVKIYCTSSELRSESTSRTQPPYAAALNCCSRVSKYLRSETAKVFTQCSTSQVIAFSFLESHMLGLRTRSQVVLDSSRVEQNHTEYEFHPDHCFCKSNSLW